MEKIHQYRCPGCSAPVVFEPKDGALVCPFCGRKEEIPASKDRVVERSFEDYLSAKPDQMGRLSEKALEANCLRCGAGIVFEPPQVAGECPFCTTPVVAQPKSEDPGISPQAILPFGIPRPRVTEAIRGWLRSRWFAPNALKAIQKHDKVQGVYLPFWTYDTHTTTHYTGQRGEYYYETEEYETTNARGERITATRQVRRTRWYAASGVVERFFDDILIPATRVIAPERLNQLEPWGLDKLESYNPAFLAGFKAQKYQADVTAGFEMARAVMTEALRENVRADIGGDEQRIADMATSYSAVSFKHLLLPVWLTAYAFAGKIYQVMVNARTGEVVGDRPYSAWKIAGAVLLGLIVLAILALLVSRR